MLETWREKAKDVRGRAMDAGIRHRRRFRRKRYRNCSRSCPERAVDKPHAGRPHVQTVGAHERFQSGAARGHRHWPGRTGDPPRPYSGQAKPVELRGVIPRMRSRVLSPPAQTVGRHHCDDASERCRLRDMSETTLYPTVKRFLEAAGFRVKGEVAAAMLSPCATASRCGSRSWR